MWLMQKHGVLRKGQTANGLDNGQGKVIQIGFLASNDHRADHP